MYYLDNQRFPTTAQGIQALFVKPTLDPVPSAWKVGGYLDTIPKDPWGKPYQYTQPGVRSAVDVFSFGADGLLNGTGVDADIFD